MVSSTDSTALMPAFAASTEWRRITLERQLPAPRFPAGVAVPGWICSGLLLLLSAFCVFYVDPPRPPAVETAVVDAQRELTSELARASTVQVNRTNNHLAAMATTYLSAPARDPQTLLTTAQTAVASFAGGIVADDANRAIVAFLGDTVPIELVPQPLEEPVTSAYTTGEQTPRLLFARPLGDGRILVAVADLFVRPLILDTESQQSIAVGLGERQIVHSQGAPLTSRAEDLVRRALHDGDGHRSATETRQITGSSDADVVAVAPVGETGASVVSVVRAPMVATGSRWPGIVTGGSLLGVTLVVLGLVYFGLTTPVHRLARRARAVASGSPRPRMRFLRSRELRGIDAAFADVAARLRGHRSAGHPRRRRFSATGAVVVATLALAAWAGTVTYIYTVGRPSPALPVPVARANRNLVDGAALALRDTLREGLVRISTTASTTLSADSRDLVSQLRELADDSRFRSVYAVDRTNRIAALAGSTPLRTVLGLPTNNGVTIDPGITRVPAIYAYTHITADVGIVAEFDVRYLASVLVHAGGRARLVDEQLRTILDTDGYIPFQPLPAGVLAEQARGASAEDLPARVAVVRGISVLVNATRIDWGETPTDLAWVVVAERPVSEFALAGNDARRAAWFVALIATSIALLFFVWHVFILIRPLRTLAIAADRMRAGQLHRVIAPSRLDEIGAIALCLEVCRQSLVDGAGRLGGAVRMRGGASDHTTIIDLSDPPNAGPESWRGEGR